MARPRDHCYNRNTTARFACTVELHVTLNYIKTFSVAQKCLIANFCLRKEQNLLGSSFRF